MFRAYRITDKGQVLIDRITRFDVMPHNDAGLAVALCQAKLELNPDGVLFYNPEIPNIILACEIMRLEERKLIERDEAMELIYTLPLIGEYTDSKEYTEWERPLEY